MRTIVEIPAEQIAALDSYCEEEKVSRAEAVRRAVSHFVPVKDEKPAASIKDDPAFGAWKDRKLEGVALQRELREEWESR